VLRVIKRDNFVTRKEWDDKFNSLKNTFSRELDIYLKNVARLKYLGTSLIIKSSCTEILRGEKNRGMSATVHLESFALRSLSKKQM